MKIKTVLVFIRMIVTLHNKLSHEIPTRRFGDTMMDSPTDIVLVRFNIFIFSEIRRTDTFDPDVSKNVCITDRTTYIIAFS